MTPTRHVHVGLDRRTFLRRAGATVAAAGIAGPFTGVTAANGLRSEHRDPATPPTPIPGGAFTLPDGTVLHVFAPGPTDVTLPFTGLTLMGEDVEPATITNFSGQVALAFLAGQARGNDGVTYNLESDMRAFEGEFIGVDGARHRGAFGFV